MSFILWERINDQIEKFFQLFSVSSYLRNFGKHTSNYDVAYSAVELREHDSFIIIIMNLPKNSIFKVFLGWLKYIPTLFFFYQNRFNSQYSNAMQFQVGMYVQRKLNCLVFSVMFYVRRCFPIVFVVSLNGIMCQLIRNIIRQESFLGDEKSVASLSFDTKHYMVCTWYSFIIFRSSQGKK